MGDYQGRRQRAGLPEHDQRPTVGALDRRVDRVGRIADDEPAAHLLRTEGEDRYPTGDDDLSPGSDSAAPVYTYICACNFHSAPEGIQPPILLCDHSRPVRSSCGPPPYIEGGPGADQSAHSVDSPTPGASATGAGIQEDQGHISSGAADPPESHSVPHQTGYPTTTPARSAAIQRRHC